MATTPLPDLTTLDATLVAARRDLLTAAITALAPEADLKRGVLHDLVLQLHSVLDASVSASVDIVREQGSLQSLLDDPESTDSDVVDRLVANYQVTRQPATTATGTITIVLDSLVPVTLSAGSLFTIAGLSFTAPTLFAARTSSGSVVTSTDRLLVARGDGTYSFTIDVVCSTAGSAGNVLLGTLATPAAPPPRFVRAYTAGTFTRGREAETNSQLLARLLAGAALRAYGARASLEGLIRQNFPTVTALSILGCGDAEQLRDRHGLFPVSSGGRVDVLVQTQPLYTKSLVSVQASLISKVGAVGTWQAGLGRDSVPGLYELEKILQASESPTSSGLGAINDVRSWDISSGYAPDLTSVAESAYSPFQTAIFQWIDTQTDASSLSIGSTRTYQLVIRGLPQLRVIQDYLADSQRRPLGSDVLVRAPIPCFCTLGFNLIVPASSTLPDLPTIQARVALAVNTLGFSGRLSASTVSRAVTSFRSDLSVDTVQMNGRIRRPDGSTLFLSGSQSLIVPATPSVGVSPATVSFFLEPAFVAITVVQI